MGVYTCIVIMRSGAPNRQRKRCRVLASIIAHIAFCFRLMTLRLRLRCTNNLPTRATLPCVHLAFSSVVRLPYTNHHLVPHFSFLLQFTLQCLQSWVSPRIQPIERRRDRCRSSLFWRIRRAPWSPSCWTASHSVVLHESRQVCERVKRHYDKTHALSPVSSPPAALWPPLSFTTTTPAITADTTARAHGRSSCSQG